VAIALSLALVGFDRLAGVAALIWVGARLPALLADTPGETGAVITVMLLKSAASRRSRSHPGGARATRAGWRG
jgi:hypothetical protein